MPYLFFQKSINLAETLTLNIGPGRPTYEIGPKQTPQLSRNDSPWKWKRNNLIEGE